MTIPKKKTSLVVHIFLTLAALPFSVAMALILLATNSLIYIYNEGVVPLNRWIGLKMYANAGDDVMGDSIRHRFKSQCPPGRASVKLQCDVDSCKNSACTEGVAQ